MVRKTNVFGDNSDKIKWSEDQKKIFEHVKYGRGHAFVTACAGSGKTTVTRAALNYTQPNSRVLFLAFNKDIQLELEAKTPKHVTVRTYHSFGLSVLRQTFGKVDVDPDKVDKILNEIVPDRHLFGKRLIYRKLVGLAKNHNTIDPQRIMELALHHGMLVYNPERYVENIDKFVIPILEKCKQNIQTVDFDDMCWLPAVLDVKSPKYDFVGIDEVQDTDYSQREILGKTLRPAGRLLGVGDVNQNIYSFRGASVDGVNQLVDKFKAKTLSMPVTYRCSQAVVRKAQTIVSEIRAAPNAPEGSVDTYIYDNFLDDVEPGDMVLCRTTAPLVEPCFSLIEKGIKALIRGLEFGENLIAIIHKQRASSLSDLFKKLREYQDQQVAFHLARERPELAQQVIDQIASIWSFSIGASTIECVIKRIGDIFKDDIEGIVFSTIHRAKGLEADNVWLLRPDLLPHPNAKFDWELQQERNLEYVAYTRARTTLNIVVGGYPKRTRDVIRKKTGDEHFLNQFLDEDRIDAL